MTISVILYTEPLKGLGINDDLNTNQRKEYTHEKLW